MSILIQTVPAGNWSRMCVIQGKSMKLKLMTSSVIAGLMFAAGAAHADPVSVSGGTVHFEGELVNAACAVSTKSADQTVTLEIGRAHV